MHNRLSADVVRQIEAALAESNRSQRLIAKEFGVSLAVVGVIRRGKHAVQLGVKPRKPPRVGGFDPVVDPTPEEIIERAAEVRRRRPTEPRKRTRYSFPMLSQL